MRHMLLVASVLAMTASMPALAQGKGNGHGNAGHQQQRNGPAAGNPGKGQGNGHGNGRPEAKAMAVKAAPGRSPHPQPAAARIGVAHGDDKAKVQAAKIGKADVVRIDPSDKIRGERRAVRVEDVRRIARLPERRISFINGCPRGLAAKNNGCLPPGQAKKFAQARPYYDNWWRYRDEGDSIYRSGDGYLYRINPMTSAVSAFIPLLGGALAPGNVWPQNYAATPVSDYYRDYYGYGDNYDYRYADGAIYGVDPSTNTIGQIAALLTGDQWNIGQAMPDGYGIYNVPYAYRSQYPDTADALYRYDDGYVYQVDPTTQIVKAIIQLIA